MNDIILYKKLINGFVKKGKKALALKIFLNLLKNLHSFKNTNLTSFQLITKTFINIRPLLYLQKFRKKSKIFMLPKLINTQQKINLSLRWFFQSVQSRKEKKVEDRVVNEFLDCFFGKGSTLAKKQNVYNIILMNRPFLNLLRYK